MDLWWDINFYYSAATRLLRMMSQQWYQSHLYNPETESKNKKDPEKAIAQQGGAATWWAATTCLHVEPFRSCLEPLETFSSRYYLSGAVGIGTRDVGIGTPLQNKLAIVQLMHRVPVLPLSIGTPNGYWNFWAEENV
ncbi:hypothetical protein GQ457_17G011620 [Hibiscus cannabinus]